jgi:universal stress protein A
MKKFKKILCPYDFSEYANEALLFAMSLGGKDTVITMLHIIELPYHFEPDGMIYMYEDYDTFKKNTREKLNSKKEEIQKKQKAIKLESKVITEVNPAEAILDMAKTKKPDLIVMGSHGRRGIERLLMGSVAESVLREADCPVLIIKFKQK